MTANAMQGDREACLASGMDDYISKPIRLEELAQALSQVQPSRPPESVAVAGNSQAEPAIAEEVFRKFQLSMGEEDSAVVLSLIRDYLAESPPLVAELRQAASQGDLEKVRRVSHSLKSSSMLFGGMRLAETCKSIEVNARNGQLPPSPGQILCVEKEYAAVEQALKGKLAASAE